MQIDPRILSTGGTQSERVKGTQNDSTSSKGATKTSDTNASASQDTVSISSKHGEVQTLSTQLAKVPDVRTERVSELQKQVRSGTYKPDSRQIAEALIADHARINVKA